MRDNDRPRGVMVHPLPAASGPFDHYALLVRLKDGQVMMVHSEGVGYPVHDDKPWRWDDFSDDAEVFTPTQLRSLAFHAPHVDLADWVRQFGQRLESNFNQIYYWATH